MSHTPGPWTYDLVHCTHFGTTGYEVGPLGATVAVMGTNPTEAEQEANARLIAAAPELLEALQDASAGLLEWMSNHNDEVDETDDNLLAKIAAAIAKATT